MSRLALVVLVVVVVDQAIKLLLRRSLGSAAVELGPCASIRVVPGRLWLRRIAGQFSNLALWSAWLAAALALVTCSAFALLNVIHVGLLLGASLSHAAESTLRGSVIDYICLPNRTVFNLADLALAAGAIGIIGDLAVVAGQRLS
jgi:lipoprotein signal peptidase